MGKAYTVEEAKKRVRDSIEKAVEFNERTQGAVTDIEAIRARREELLDIITELQWRYGNDTIMRFYFSKKSIRPEGSIPIEDIIEKTRYSKRIYVLEDSANGKFFDVFIRF